MSSNYSITNDPIFYIVAAIFALLTTALPAGLGQMTLLPLLQTLGFFVFLLMLIRAGNLQRAPRMVLIWIVIQFAAILLLSWLLPQQAEQAIQDGFNRRVTLLEWFYAASPLPDSWQTRPLARVLEVLAILLGSLFTGGLVGSWVLMRAVNLAAYYSGALVAAPATPLVLIAALLPWMLLRLAGYAGMVVLLAEPLLTGNWSPAYYARERGRWLQIAAGLLLIGLLMELLLPNLWRALLAPPRPG